MSQQRGAVAVLRRMKAVAAGRPWVVDTIWAVVLATVGTLLLANTYVVSAGEPYVDAWATPWQSAVASALAYAPLVVRRRWPVTVLAIMSLAHILYVVWFVPEGVVVSVAYLLAMYTVGDIGAVRWRFAARAWSIGLIGVAYVWAFTRGPLSPGAGILVGSLSWVSSVVVLIVFFVGAWLLGNAAHERRERERLLRQRAAELEAEREENARRAVLDERVRIARELHDVVAHTVSVMGIQAGAARRVFAEDPAAASKELESIEQTSRSAVAELQRLLGFLRADDPAATASETTTAGARSPQPGIEHVDELVSQTSSAGVHTDLTIIGNARELPPGVSLSVYRIVQEALTNTLKHGRAHKAEVLLTYADGTIEVEVLDDGQGPKNPPDHAAGHGMVGMRERAALHNGEIEVGARTGGGFRVWARLATGHVRLEAQPA